MKVFPSRHSTESARPSNWPVQATKFPEEPDLETKHREARPLFHLYSRGGLDELKQLAARFDARVHVDINVQETLLNIILAEGLVMGPSGFSYLAGLLSEGQKLARAHWWHHLAGLPDWILAGADGSAVTTERQAEGN